FFLTAQQVDDRFRADLKACSRLDDRKANLLTKGWATNGDVLLSHNATVGRVALLEGIEERVLLGTSLTFYRFNDEYVDPRYAMYLFASPFFQNQLSSVMKQTTRDQVPITKQVSLNFICPPIEEQRTIAAQVGSLLKFATNLDEHYERAVAAVEI